MTISILELFRRLRKSEGGVTMIEYALIAALVSIVAISLLSAIGGRVKNLFSTVNSGLTTA
jgi:pilus assembly protein Flp/PilA